jgi:hypothetical protein
MFFSSPSVLRFYYVKNTSCKNKNPIANAISNKNRLIKPQDATSVQPQLLKYVLRLYSARSGVIFSNRVAQTQANPCLVSDRDKDDKIILFNANINVCALVLVPEAIRLDYPPG